MTPLRRLLPSRTCCALAVRAGRLATLAGAVGALAVYRADQDLSTGTMRLGVDPGHRGALDIYVPLVDWGARFPGVRLPARLRMEARTSRARRSLGSQAGAWTSERLRPEARDAIEPLHPRAGGARRRRRARPGRTRGARAARRRAAARAPLLVSALGTAILAAGAVALLLPPRGSREPGVLREGFSDPGRAAGRPASDWLRQAISQDLDDQLVKLARLISIPRERARPRPLPRLTVASDLHNNLLALPALERAARGTAALLPRRPHDQWAAVGG